MSRDIAMTVVRLLDAVAAGTMSATECLKQYPEYDKDPRRLFEGAWASLSHFANDYEAHPENVTWPADYPDIDRVIMRKQAAKLRKEYAL